eukprot:Cvel_11618.t1-p1 / transcript=Cvel_11618.t1 / gene=Cvel_11618 / organism=Chromera_velia_CCMP2878 / gene_product=hypothetical protein / transcript_product=hypothetical protein / location=Cvel_scaffold735:68378-70286(+) / protein_length=286 / sequence_SO=supercontig / SO=protein_coding / is_pseudo=false
MSSPTPQDKGSTVAESETQSLLTGTRIGGGDPFRREQGRYRDLSDFLYARMSAFRGLVDFWNRSSLVTKVLLAFGLLELLIVGLSLLESLSFRRALVFTRLQAAEGQLHLLALSFAVKVDQIGTAFRLQPKNSAFTDLLEAHYWSPGNTTLWTEVKTRAKTVLQDEVYARQMEFATLVNSEGIILVNANADREGESWDPSGLVSLVRDQWERGQVKSTEVISYADVLTEAPPVFRERSDISFPTPLLHPTDTQKAALVRWVLTPVVNATGSSEGGPALAGVLVAGD